MGGCRSLGGDFGVFSHHLNMTDLLNSIHSGQTCSMPSSESLCMEVLSMLRWSIMCCLGRREERGRRDGLTRASRPRTPPCCGRTSPRSSASGDPWRSGGSPRPHRCQRGPGLVACDTVQSVSVNLCVDEESLLLHPDVDVGDTVHDCLNITQEFIVYPSSLYCHA